MLYPIRSFVRDRWISVPFLTSMALELFLWWYAITRISPTSDLLFLHYNILFGVDLVGEWWKLYLIPLAILGLIAVNFGLSYLFYLQNRFVARFLSVLTVFYLTLVLIGSVLIIGLNI